MCKFNWHIFSKLIMDCREKFLKCPKPLAIAATGLCWPIRSNRWSRRRTPSTKFYSGRFHPEIQSLRCPFREPVWPENSHCSGISRVEGGGGGRFCFGYSKYSKYEKLLKGAEQLVRKVLIWSDAKVQQITQFWGVTSVAKFVLNDYDQEKVWVKPTHAY